MTAIYSWAEFYCLCAGPFLRRNYLHSVKKGKILQFARIGCLFSQQDAHIYCEYRHPDAYIYVNIGIGVPIFM